MPSYPAKPYVVPHDDWFKNNSSNFENKPKAKGIRKYLLFINIFIDNQM